MSSKEAGECRSPLCHLSKTKLLVSWSRDQLLSLLSLTLFCFVFNIVKQQEWFPLSHGLGTPGCLLWLPAAAVVSWGQFHPSPNIQSWGRDQQSRSSILGETQARSLPPERAKGISQFDESIFGQIGHSTNCLQQIGF